MTQASPVKGHASSHASGNPDRPREEIDISSREFWHGDMFDREKSFAKLRAKESITWHRPFESS